MNLIYAGDIESMPFIEALGQFSYHVGKLICSGPLFYRLIKRDFSFYLGSVESNSYLAAVCF
jgi:hypothetical protein